MDPAVPTGGALMPGKIVEGTRAAIGGWFLRPYIQQVLGGKDWFESLTVWGLIIFVAADAVTAEVCARGLMSAAWCADAVGFLKTVGGILGVLGVRRAALRGPGA